LGVVKKERGKTAPEMGAGPTHWKECRLPVLFRGQGVVARGPTPRLDYVGNRLGEPLKTFFVIENGKLMRERDAPNTYKKGFHNSSGKLHTEGLKSRHFTTTWTNFCHINSSYLDLRKRAKPKNAVNLVFIAHQIKK